MTVRTSHHGPSGTRSVRGAPSRHCLFCGEINRSVAKLFGEGVSLRCRDPSTMTGFRSPLVSELTSPARTRFYPQRASPSHTSHYNSPAWRGGGFVARPAGRGATRTVAATSKEKTATSTSLHSQLGTSEQPAVVSFFLMKSPLLQTKHLYYAPSLCVFQTLGLFILGLCLLWQRITLTVVFLLHLFTLSRELN